MEKEEDRTTVPRTFLQFYCILVQNVELEARLYDANGLISKALKRGWKHMFFQAGVAKHTRFRRALIKKLNGNIVRYTQVYLE